MESRDWKNSAYSNSEQNGDYGSLGGQHVDLVPRLILHLNAKWDLSFQSKIPVSAECGLVFQIIVSS